MKNMYFVCVNNSKATCDLFKSHSKSVWLIDSSEFLRKQDPFMNHESVTLFQDPKFTKEFVGNIFVYFCASLREQETSHLHTQEKRYSTVFFLVVGVVLPLLSFVPFITYFTPKCVLEHT